MLSNDTYRMTKAHHDRAGTGAKLPSFRLFQTHTICKLDRFTGLREQGAKEEEQFIFEIAAGKKVLAAVELCTELCNLKQRLTKCINETSKCFEGCKLFSAQQSERIDLVELFLSLMTG